jgi:hypothetical protein
MGESVLFVVSSWQPLTTQRRSFPERFVLKNFFFVLKVGSRGIVDFKRDKEQERAVVYLYNM